MNAENIIEETIKKIDPSSFRYEVLSEVNHFKFNWITLGKILSRVAKDRHFEEWGYKSFEEYCQLEVRIKKSTAMKLTSAWYFLKDEEPDLIPSKDIKEFKPEIDFEKVHLLQKAKESETFTPEMYAKLKESALKEKQSSTGLKKKFRELNDALSKLEEKDQFKKPRELSEKLKRELVKVSAPDSVIELVQKIEDFIDAEKS